MNSDPISDMLTRIRNGARANLMSVSIPHSNIKEGIAAILKEEGYISSYSVEGGDRRSIVIALKYEGRKSVIEGLRRISAPGLRRYVASVEIPRVRGGLGISVLSTSQGVVTGKKARSANIGGELLCYVW